MSKKFGIFGFLCFMGLVFLFTMLPVQKRAEAGTPSNQHILLKATFSDSYIENGVTYTCNITNDVPGVPYEHVSYRDVTQNGIMIYNPGRRGHFTMFINYDTAPRRYVPMQFVGDVLIQTPGSACEKNAYFLADKRIDVTDAYTFKVSTSFKWNKVNAEGELILQATDEYLDFSKIAVGETIYCSAAFRFHVADNPLTASKGKTGYDESAVEIFFDAPIQVRVYYGDIDDDGVLEWVIRPIAEPFTLLDMSGNPEHYPDGFLTRMLYSGTYPYCYHGAFFFPFELILERQ